MLRKRRCRAPQGPAEHPVHISAPMEGGGAHRRAFSFGTGHLDRAHRGHCEEDGRAAHPPTLHPCFVHHQPKLLLSKTSQEGEMLPLLGAHTAGFGASPASSLHPRNEASTGLALHLLNKHPTRLKSLRAALPVCVEGSQAPSSPPRPIPMPEPSPKHTHPKNQLLFSASAAKAIKARPKP